MKKPAVQADFLRSYSAYIRADRIESFVKHKISSVDMLCIVHDSHAFGVKPRQHKRGAASEVAGVYLCRLQIYLPEETVSKASICACKSVGKPGYGEVSISEMASGRLRHSI